MSGVALTCAETPLAWPAGVDPGKLTTCTTCGIRFHTPNAGSLQILTRRQGGGVGDGVNIEESPSVGADYRGQRYSLQEAILHVPGLHVLPGDSAPPPAEYHIHMVTYSKPQRYLTVVIPLSHTLPPSDNQPGEDYFAATAAQPDPSAQRPVLSTILPPGIPLLQYMGPDIRGRTAAVPAPSEQCTSTDERVFLVLTRTLKIRATDLERIPREGSLSTDPRNLPAPGVEPTQKVPQSRLLSTVTLAMPGILGAPTTTSEKSVETPAGQKEELECRPLKVVDGRDVVDISGQAVDISTLLGLGGGLGATRSVSSAEMTDSDSKTRKLVRRIAIPIGIYIGLLAADLLFGMIWPIYFKSGLRSETVKDLIFLFISGLAGLFADSLNDLWSKIFG